METEDRIRIVTFGSDPTCYVQVAGDPYVSAFHARATQYRDGRVTIEDLGSTNGTSIERHGIRTPVHGPREMRPGDILYLGIRTRIPWTDPIDQEK